MKKVLLFLLLPVYSFATNYYVSNTGDDAAAGTAITSAWKTIDKVNAFGFGFNDSILFKRGDVFYGAIVVSRGNINFGAYGSGAKPVITGLSTITGWVNLGGNIWEAPTINVRSINNLVLRDGKIQQVGRYPNANAPNGGYLTYTASTATSITGPALSSATNWTGAEVAVRLFRWEIRRRTVTSHVGSVVNFATMIDIPKVNFGYFFQRDSRTLDQDGEWWQDGSNNKLRMYFANNNPGTYTIQAASLDTLFYNTKSTISITNLTFSGSNKAAIMNAGCKAITVKNCDAVNSGEDAIAAWFCTNLTVDSCTTTNSLGSGIRVRGASSGVVNLAVKNCAVNNTALIPGMETSDVSSSRNGILCSGGDNVQILNNVVKNSGYNGIEWKGNNVYIRNNFVDNFASVRDDGGGIYTWEAPAGTVLPVRTNRTIVSNIIINGISAPDGTSGASQSSVAGIYVDEGTRDVIIDSNTIANMLGSAIHGNSNGNITITNNTTFKTINSASFQQLSDDNPIGGIVIKKNIFYPYRFRYRNVAINLPSLQTKEQDILEMGEIDSNYFCLRPGPDTSLTAVTTWKDGSHYLETFNAFPYIPANCHIETHSIKVRNNGVLEYNATGQQKTISVDPRYANVYGTKFNGTVTLAPFTSVVLIIPNETPVANAGADKLINLPTNSVSINGLGTDTDGTISSYSWVRLSGPAAGTIDAPAAASMSLNNLVQGIYTYQFSVIDNEGAIGMDTVQITVNQPPLANAGVDKIITLPTSSVTLSGSGTDEDGTISSYQWAKISGPNAGTIDLPYSATTDINNLAKGIYIFQLTITDNFGATATATVQIIVNQPPVVDIGNDRLVNLPNSSINLSATAMDYDGTITGYEWVELSGPSDGIIISPSDATTGINNLIQGIYIYQVTVTDNYGATGTAIVHITVNRPPIADAGSEKIINLPINNTTLFGTATDADGTIANYKWVKLSGPVAGTIDLPDEAVTTLSNLVQGVYVFELTVKDDNGATGTAQVQVVVNAAPKANAGPDKIINLPVNITTLSGGGTDADGAVIGYAWRKLSGPAAGTILTPNTAAADLDDLVQGIYVYQLIVTDNNGATATATVQVTVNAAPVANAGTDKLVNLPANTTTLTGSGTDADGTIASYAWTKLSGPATGTITTPTAATTTVSGLVQGVYIYQLTVTDNSGATATATVQVTVNAAPVANAGTGKLVNLPANTTTLTGSGTDADGTIASYAWTKLSGPATGTIATPTAATTTVNGLVQGVYIYQITVTDNNGATGTANVQVTVNAAPVANAGTGKLVNLPANTTTLTGSGTDADGTIASYAWTKLSGPATGTITTPTAATTTVSGLVQGVYVYQLTVTDNNGTTATATVQVTVNAAPVANAGTDKLVNLPANTTTLTGSGTDADGTIASYAWTKLSGPATGTITTPTAATTTLSGLVQGVYVYQLTVTDNNGATGTATVQVTVNAAPVANAGTDKLVNLPANTTTLTGSGTDADGTIASYAWTKLSGPATGTITTPTAATTTVSGLVQGVYVYQLTVTDNNGATGTANVQVTVNAAPVANAGTDKLVNLPANTTTLTGSGTDADGTIASYAWNKLSGPATGTITTPTAATTTVSGLVQGIYVYQLTVTDNNGATGTANVQVTVNAAPVANAGTDKLVNLPANTTTLTGSGTDADGTIASYAWTKLSGPATGTITTPTAATTTVSGLVQGVYVYQLTVTDNNGATATATVQVTINAAPVANAGTDKIVNLPANTTTLTGSGTDVDGTIASYAWTKLSGPATGTITTPTAATTTVSGLVQGVYVYQLTVTDNNGATGTATVQVTVNAAPVANAGTDKLVNLPANTTTLTGSGTDADGTIASYAWNKLSGPATGTITTPTAATTTVSGLVQGIYVYQLTVTDNNGATGTATVQVTVNAAPVANAGTDKLVNLPANTTTLTGSGTDADGTIASYAWTKLSGPVTGTIATPTAATTTLSGLVQGVYIYQLTVTDNNGATATATVQVTVNAAPVANAGTDKLVNLPANTTTLTGSGTDADGTIASYAWTKLSGPATGTITTPTAATTTVSGLVQGVCVYQLTVTDNNGATGTANVQVTVNAAPVANAGTDKLVNLPANTTTLTGSGTDADGTIASYAWNKLSGPTAGTISTPTAATTTVSGLVQGIYIYQLTVTDNNGATGTANVQVTINAAPVANAGTDKLVNLPANTTTLTGSGTDADGTIASYAWTKLSGPATGTITTPIAATTTLSGLVQGVYVYQLTVTDNNGATGTATVQVTVNAAPVANAGTDKIVNLPANTTTLTGSGTDADGTIASYAWTKLSGPATGTITTPTAATTTLSGLVQGVYVYQLTVTDNNGATGTATIQVTVNAAPVANAGTDKFVNLPANTTTLTGSGTDADGTIASYAWTKLSGPATGTIATPTAATTTVNGLVQGVYIYQITVTDNNGATGTANVQVTVNAAPVANAGTGKLVNLPANTTTLTGSGTDADGTIASYAWTKLSGPATGTITTPTAATTTVSGLVQGVYVYQLTVTDNNGTTATATVQVTVNAAPVANAGTDKLVNLPANTTTLTGSGTDADGTIASYAWTKLSGPATGTITTPTAATTTLSGLVQGVYVYQLTVTDNNGATGTATVQVTVNAAPVANAGTDKLVNLPANTTTLTGSGTDADGTIASYAWTKLSGPATGTITTPTAATTTVSGLVQGVYVYQLTVTDNNGATGTANVQVTVNAAPVANAGTDKLVNLPANTTTLTGSGTDADGTIASYAWNKLSGPATGTITTPTAATTTVSGLVQGIYVYQLTVTDNNGATGTANVQVTVNAAPVANAGTDKLVNLPANTTTLTGSGTDADGTIASYAWTKLSGPATGTITTPTAATTTVSGLVQGVYVYQLTVTDNNGATATATVQVTINAAPVANAGTDKIVNLPANTTTLTGSGTDVDGTIASYAWTKLSGPATGTITTPTAATTTVNGLVQGVYIYQLTVADNNGATGKDTVQVTINRAPTANAGTDKIINLPTNTTTLTGSGADADGTIASYAWVKISGPTTGTITAPTAATTTLSSLIQGVYLYQLTVTDKNGATGKDTVQVIINGAPTANAGTDKIINLPTNTTTLTGSGADADGTIASYAWVKISGPTTGTITTPTAATTNLTSLIQGLYLYQLTVTDNNGATGKDTVQVTINRAPTANAGTDKIINLPTNTTTLTGSGADADGTIASYAWVKISGPTTGTITAPTAATTTLTSLIQGVYLYQLTVTDNNGATGKDTVQVTVNTAVNQPPIANAGADKAINSPASTTTLTGSGTDPDGTISSYAWLKISGPATGTIVTANAATTTLNSLAQGTYLYQLTVTDNKGATGKDTVQVKVNRAPVSNAGVDKMVALPTNSTTLTGSGTDTDGTIASYVWIKISGPTNGSIATANAAVTALNNLVQGVYKYQLTVTDNNGATGKDTVQVTVTRPPTANAGTDKTISLPTNSTALTGSGTDPDGTVASYAWAKISGPAAGAIATPNAPTTSLTALVQGTYQFQLTATDNSGATGKDTVKVLVNRPPTANAGLDKTVTLPTKSTIVTGTGTDADGSVTSYAWMKISGPSSGTIVTPTAATTTINNLVQGTYQYQLTVTDNNGATAKDTVKITVNSASGIPITIVRPAKPSFLNTSSNALLGNQKKLIDGCEEKNKIASASHISTTNLTKLLLKLCSRGRKNDLHELTFIPCYQDHIILHC